MGLAGPSIQIVYTSSSKQPIYTTWVRSTEGFRGLADSHDWKTVVSRYGPCIC